MTGHLWTSRTGKYFVVKQVSRVSFPDQASTTQISQRHPMPRGPRKASTVSGCNRSHRQRSSRLASTSPNIAVPSLKSYCIRSKVTKPRVQARFSFIQSAISGSANIPIAFGSSLRPTPSTTSMVFAQEQLRLRLHLEGPGHLKQLAQQPGDGYFVLRLAESAPQWPGSLREAPRDLSFGTYPAAKCTSATRM